MPSSSGLELPEHWERFRQGFSRVALEAAKFRAFTTERMWASSRRTFHIDEGPTTACGLKLPLMDYTDTAAALVDPDERCGRNGCRQQFDEATRLAGYAVLR